MESSQLVAAVFVAMALGCALPVGAQPIQKQERKTPQNSRQSPPASGPANNAAPQQDKAPDEASKGHSGGPATGARQTIPGTGGAAKAQDPTASPSTPASPSTGNTLVNPNQVKPQDGKVVGPEYFKSKDEQLRDLANPGVPTDSSPPPGGETTRRKLNPTGQDVLDGVSTTVTPEQGRNPTSRRQQQSEDPAPAPRITASGKMEGTTGVVTVAGNRGEATFKFDDGKLTHETVKVTDKDATIVMEKDHTTKTEVLTVTDAYGITYQKVDGGEWTTIGRTAGGKKTPNPETDPGDNVPPGVGAPQVRQKSPSELAAERGRQVTQPTDDQRRQFERMRMDAEVALKSAQSKRTSGRIDEDPNASGPVGNSGAPRQGSGAGCKQVDCAPSGSRPVTD